MRPVNQIIEFKQIVGRGTRTFDGKDYFTIYDFVDAHQRFLDPEWDGEPEEPVMSLSQEKPNRKWKMSTPITDDEERLDGHKKRLGLDLKEVKN